MASHYLDPVQRREIARLLASRTARSEWPTWLLIVAIPAGWLLGAHAYAAYGAWLGAPVMVWFTAWYLSLQHELIHGHPTRRESLNALLGSLPLGLFYPYPLYRRSHLAHHVQEHLTDPRLDPESCYCLPQRWRRASRPLRALLWANKTLLGRLTLGPWIAVGAFAIAEGRLLLSGDRYRWRVWGLHLALCAAMLALLERHFSIPALAYLLTVAYPALSLSMLRSFYEHRPDPESPRRCVLNEAEWPLRWLFLHNNLHLVHHDLPGVPWFLLPTIYRRRRDAYIARSGHFLEAGYVPLARRHAVSAVDAPWHPEPGEPAEAR